MVCFRASAGMCSTVSRIERFSFGLLVAHCTSPSIGQPTSIRSDRSIGTFRLNCSEAKLARNLLVSCGESVCHIACPALISMFLNSPFWNASSTRPVAGKSVAAPFINTWKIRPPISVPAMRSPCNTTPSPLIKGDSRSASRRSPRIAMTLPTRTPCLALVMPGTSLLWLQPSSQPGVNPREKLISISRLAWLVHWIS